MGSTQLTRCCCCCTTPYKCLHAQVCTDALGRHQEKKPGDLSRMHHKEAHRANLAYPTSNADAASRHRTVVHLDTLERDPGGLSSMHHEAGSPHTDAITTHQHRATWHTS
jgi:hypothetical protein